MCERLLRRAVQSGEHAIITSKFVKGSTFCESEERQIPRVAWALAGLLKPLNCCLLGDRDAYAYGFTRTRTRASA